jgi:hypothetical protein
MHEEGERTVDDTVISDIRSSFSRGNNTELLNKLLSLERFPYKDSYVGFLRKDRTAIGRNPQTVQRICDRLYAMGIDKVIEGVSQSKEANQRRGPQFRAWVNANFRRVGLSDFRRSTTGIVVLEATELEARNFCNTELGVGISKRPDLVAKSGRKYVIGEAKFLSSSGGNQGRAFDDGMNLATNASGSAYKVFVLDGVLWIETGSNEYNRIEHSTAAVFSALLLRDFFDQLALS